jgi:biotin carboxyl carrier protein
MKFQAKMGDATRQVEIKRDGRRVFAKVDNREYELEASEPEPNVYLLKHDGRVHEVFVSPGSKAGEPVLVSANGLDIEVTLIDPKRLRGASSGGDHADGHADIKTAMPGKVVRIIAEKGATVAKGDAVLVVEAMKMQNELRSPKDGVVADIRAVEGATVAAGEILAVIE